MKRDAPEPFRGLRGRMLVSCQAWEDDPFHGPEHAARFAAAAVEGGAAGIRANGPEDVRAILAAVRVPLIAIQKRAADDERILITPTFEDAAALVRAGADCVALDCTARGQRYGALERLRRIRRELGVPVAADVATAREGSAAAEAGADFILSTMRGYTEDTAHVQAFDAGFIAELVLAVDVPVIAEGRIWTREEARAALAAGAFAIVIGSAITRPREIAGYFARAIESFAGGEVRWAAGLDAGGTKIKAALVAEDGRVAEERSFDTRASEGRAVVLAQVRQAASHVLEAASRRGIPIAGLGVATAGWVSSTGEILYGTGNLPEWTGTPMAEALRDFGLPLVFENDAHAVAVAEHRFGAARGCSDFMAVTLGTGVGGAVFSGGALVRGVHRLGGALGHVNVDARGLRCTCGRLGCLEPYANAGALLRYTAPLAFANAEAVIAAARDGDAGARAAIRTLAGWLARGLAAGIELFDPELIVLAGGMARENPWLLESLREAVAGCMPEGRGRGPEVRVAELGYYAGAVGAGVAALR